jgi:hypothetical protein
MPAVQLARLAQQIDVLVWQFTRPSDFIARLRDLFDFYADRVYRAGQAVPPASMASAYHIPVLVMRQLEIELRAPSKQHPTAALSLVDALWKESKLEFKILATLLLGFIPLRPPEEILDRMHSYAKPGSDTQVLNALLENGGRSLRQEMPARWLDLIEGWANDNHVAQHGMALRAIIITSQDTGFDNLPPLFRLFSALLQEGAVSLQAELQSTLLALLKRSPKETVYLLRQILSLSTRPTTHRLVRLSLSHVPPEYQPSLRQALQNQAD